MCLLKCITGLVPENPLAVNVLNKSSQHREKWKFLLSIPISIFKVFISCVLGFILLILTKKRQLRIEKICRQKVNLTTTTTATTITTTTNCIFWDIENLLFLRNLFQASHQGFLRDPGEWNGFWGRGRPRGSQGSLGSWCPGTGSYFSTMPSLI